VPLFTDRNFFLLAVAVYGVSTIYSVFLWRRGFRQANRITYCILAAGFGSHTLAMIGRGFSFSRCPVNNLYEATIFLEWAIVAAYLVLGAWSRLTFLGAFASPLLFGIGVFAMMPSLDPPFSGEPHFEGAWMSMHAASVLLAYGAFGLSSVAGLMYLTQERDLKFRKLRAVFALFPPIERLELVIGRLVTGGLVLLTVGLAMGARFLKETEGVYFTKDAKILWSVIVWLMYSGLLMMRWKYAYSGRRFVQAAVWSFAFVLLTFWGTNLLSAIHQR